MKNFIFDSDFVTFPSALTFPSPLHILFSYIYDLYAHKKKKKKTHKIWSFVFRSRTSSSGDSGGGVDTNERTIASTKGATVRVLIFIYKQIWKFLYENFSLIPFFGTISPSFITIKFVLFCFIEINLLIYL